MNKNVKNKLTDNKEKLKTIPNKNEIIKNKIENKNENIKDNNNETNNEENEIIKEEEEKKEELSINEIDKEVETKKR